MTTLGRIRSKAGLLVAVVGIALAAFILGDLVQGKNNFSMKDANDIGEIAGQTITYNEFNYRVQEAIDAQQKNTGQSVDESMKDMIVQQIWNQMINEMVMGEEYNEVGVSVSADELYDQMLGQNPHAYVQQYFTDRQSGSVIQQFAEAGTGKLNMAKVIEYNQQMNEEQEGSWVKLENAVKEARLNTKYSNLIKKGIYVTNAEAKFDHISRNKMFNVQYISKRYETIPDSTVKVSEADAKDYYNKHQNEYKQKETTRKIEYVSFDVFPSAEDEAALKDEMQKLTEEFKNTDKNMDSSFVVAESDNRSVDYGYHKKGTLSPEIDSLMFSAEPGFVYGPYKENNSYKISKLSAIAFLPDSVKARHILLKVENGDMKTAKAKADSLKNIIKAKNNFAELASAVSEDPGSKVKGGDLGWFAQGAMVKPFNDACFNGKKGDMPIVESQFGVHLIEILDKGQDTKQIQVITVERNIQPSNKTVTEVFHNASKFAGENNTAEKFEKAVKDQNLNKRIAENLKENDKSIPGMENARELVRWAYENEKGTVSQAFDFSNKFVIALITEVNPKGILPFENVKAKAEVKAIEEKKAAMFIDEFNKSMAGLTDINALAAKVNQPVEVMQRMSFNSYSLAGAGKEDYVIGYTSTLSAKKLSKPIKGVAGVYVVYVDSVEDAPEVKDLSGQKTQIYTTLQSSVDYDVFNALKENANIVDNKARFY